MIPYTKIKQSVLYNNTQNASERTNEPQMKKTYIAAAAGMTLTLFLMGLTACTSQSGSYENPTDSVTEENSTKTTASDNDNKQTNETTVSDKDSVSESDTESVDTDQAESVTDVLSESISVKFSSYELNENWQDKLDTTVTFNGDSIDVDGSGTDINGSVITITEKGTYAFSGSLTDGQIIVEVPDDDKVRLIFNGIDLNCEDSCPVFVKSADRCVIVLAEGSENTVTDGAFYTKEYADGSTPNACIYSKPDLTITGSGSLTVNGAYNNGIGSKDDIKILNATINITAIKNAIKGNDSVTIDQAILECKANNDGIKSDREGSTDKGFIYIKSGEINITAGDDALQCFTALYIKSPAHVTTVCDGQQINCDNFVSVEDGCLN